MSASPVFAVAHDIPDDVKPDHGRKQVANDTQRGVAEEEWFDAGGDDHRGANDQ